MQHDTKTVKKQNVITKAVLPPIIKKDSVVKKVYPQTDSGQLMLHLDSLPKEVFPYECSGQYSELPAVNLSAFKNKKLFHIPFKLIPTELGGGSIDEYQDSTFNLVDSVTYKARWNLIATTPKYVVIDDRDYGILATLSYNFEVIDAIHTSAGAGNKSWQIGRTTTIKKNLTMVLHHSWSVQTDAEGHFDYENAEEHWFIDRQGNILKQALRRHTRHK